MSSTPDARSDEAPPAAPGADHAATSAGTLDRALALVRFLRANCPWDAAQTAESLVPHLLEETREVVDAIYRDDPGELEGELGDLLLNLAFQIVVAGERDELSADSVTRRLEAKMRRRHPHLYGDGPKEDWEAIKARERAESRSDDSVDGGGEPGILDGITPSLDPLTTAHRMQERVARVGFDWESHHGAFDKVAEELDEVREALETGEGVEEELGDLIFAATNLVRLAGSHPVRALEAANLKFRRRFTALEALARERGIGLDEASLDELDALWDELKEGERHSTPMPASPTGHRASPSTNPFAVTGDHRPPLILDGGLATTLEARGHVLDDPLWSARVLVEAPDAVQGVHRDFIEAGADVVATVSYQASFEGLARRGLDDATAETLLRRSVALARQTRDEAVADWVERSRRRPLVAASVGPYGAFLADGSEYTGAYAIDDDELLAFHRRRWHVLVDAGPDLMACETIPSRREVDILCHLAAETPHIGSWISFSTRDAHHLADGSSLADAARACASVPSIVAVGVNCLPPERVTPALEELAGATRLPLLAYPNSGERWLAEERRWGSGVTPVDWPREAETWVALGARGVGGCCRVGVETVRELRRALVT